MDLLTVVAEHEGDGDGGVELGLGDLPDEDAHDPVSEDDAEPAVGDKDQGQDKSAEKFDHQFAAEDFYLLAQAYRLGLVLVLLRVFVRIHLV